MELDSTANKTKPKRIRAPKPRKPALRRGKACLNCRHLKIRCDGVHPICGNCVRVPKDEPCIFILPLSARRRSAAASLPMEHHSIDALTFSGSSAGYPLAPSSPSSSPESIFLLPVTEHTPGSSPAPSGSDSSSCGDALSYFSCLSESRSEDLQVEQHPETIELLLQFFLPSATQLNFFLHIDRFVTSAICPIISGLELLGDLLGPTPPLLYAVCLWGAHLAGPNHHLFSLKAAFLRRALRYLSAEIYASATRETTDVIQTIQAQVLLATYFLVNKQLLAAHVQAGGAATLAIGYKLHLLGSPRRYDQDLSEVSIRHPHDAVEEGEWIRAFWAVVRLQTTLELVEIASNMVGSPHVKAGSIHCSSNILSCFENEIETPWPGHMDDYDLLLTPPLAQSNGGESAISRLLYGELDYCCDGSSAMYPAQAAVLFSQASRMALNPTDPLSDLLLTRISLFMDSLSGLDANEDLLNAHALAAAASIILRRPQAGCGPNRQPALIDAAGTILHLLGRPGLHGIDAIAHGLTSPTTSSLCYFACSIFCDEIHAWKTHSVLFGLGQQGAPGPEAILGLQLQEGMRVLGTFVGGNPLAEQQLTEIQERYSTFFGVL
ncbi:Zn(2)-C6 fungal-type domain-containing protein [Mycena indigotica]|uniref:Zn(2)-C6 fungal-type domain-containing protein n=1 Tax=Mycena indigotica TaxID=2126181 RepID=A0A8H6VSC4_9AGAR|nr:Zn(2)-C6 fungal-type domain-containing protein [Mycena indigotica]KAF7292034.1 Zn(2)-C6 fungal-type domain-containing protein [Mycena indigotica]